MYFMKNCEKLASKLLEEKNCIHLEDFASCNNTPQDIYEVMEHFDNVTSVLETKCPYCHQWTGHFYDAYFDFPDKEICPCCGKPFGNLLSDNSHLVWKKI